MESMEHPWNPWNIHGVRESMWTPQGLPGGVISPLFGNRSASLSLKMSRYSWYSGGTCPRSGVVSSYLSANSCELESFVFIHIAELSIGSGLSEVCPLIKETIRE